MKAIKYSRFSQSWHWSQSVGEDLIYFPEIKAIVYSGGGGGKKWKGITSDAKFVEEAEQYVAQVESGEVKKYISEEHEEINKGADMGKIYSPSTLMVKDKIYVKEIPEHETVTTAPITLTNFEEVEINITPEGIKDIFQRQVEFAMKKAAFEIEQKRFEESISNINNLIVKQE